MKAASKYPSRAEAENLLKWAEGKNPGPWADHSRVAGRAADTIASACGLNNDIAFVLGLLHDIGRYEGVRDLHHVVAGHDLMLQKGFEHNAQICLTHSFPIKELGVFSGKNIDCTDEELNLIESTLDTVEYDDYDGLIQLCDAICLPQGVCLMDVRLVHVARRHGFNDFTLRKWESFFSLKTHFDGLCSGNIYDLFYDEVHKISFL